MATFFLHIVLTFVFEKMVNLFTFFLCFLVNTITFFEGMNCYFLINSCFFCAKTL